MEDFSSAENWTWWIYCTVHTLGRVDNSVPDPLYPNTFLGLPDPLVRGPDPDPFIIKQNGVIINQNSKENLYFHCIATSLWPLSVKNDVNVPSKCKKPQNLKYIFVAILKATDEKSRIQIR